MTDPLIGKTLPQVTLSSSDGRTLKLPEDLEGKWTLLYFYPKDDTPGCTKQACNYRDNLDEFKSLKVQIFGLSGDDLASHDAFIKKYSLSFPLLSDTKNELSKALGVYGDMGLSRDTFLIDPQGKIRQVWRKVNAQETTRETLEAVKNFL